MRFLGAFFILTIVAAAAGTAVAQKASPSTAPPTISLTISAVHDSVKAGSPVVIDVTLLNKSSHDIVFRREIRGRDLHVDVRDVTGKLAADTKLGYIWNGHVANLDVTRVSPQDLSLNTVIVTVKAGETLPWELDAGRLYDLSQPGKYSIQVQRQDPENPALIVKSNTITVTATP